MNLGMLKNTWIHFYFLKNVSFDLILKVELDT